MNTHPDGSNGLPGTAPAPGREAVQRWRLVLARDRIPSEAAQREQLAAWSRSLAGSGLPVAGLDAGKARARFAIAAPLAAAIAGEAELIDVWLTERLPAWRVRESLGDCLPDGWRLVDLYDVWLGEPALPGRVEASVYRASVGPDTVPAAALARAAADLLHAASLPRERRRGDTTVTYDLRPFVGDLEVEASSLDGRTIVRMTLRHDPEKGIGRPEEVLAALGERLGTPLDPATLVRERIVLGEPSRAPARAARRKTPGRTPGAL